MKFDIQSQIYFCKDMKVMVGFYTSILGLKLSVRSGLSVDEWAELDGKGFRLCLHRAGKPGSPPRNRNKLVFRVDDVGAAREYLIEHGVRMGKHHVWPHADACDGHDPEGNKFQITGPKS